MSRIAEFCTVKKHNIMKITLTGSLGNISKPLAEELLQKGHSLTIISSDPKKKEQIEAMGATAAIGTMTDANFLASAFKGADIVYLMETMGVHNFSDPNLDLMASIDRIAQAFKTAVEQSGVKKIIHLSSIGGHTNKGNGMLAFHYYAEQTLQQLPADVSIKVMRPVGFYYNMLGFIPTIKSQNAIYANYGGDEKEPWVSPRDIASVIAEEMEKPFNGRSIRYIASEELSPNEVAKILGETVGKPDLKWITLTDEQFLENLIRVGMNPAIAKGFMEMNASRRGGVLYEDYNRHRPELSKTKLKEYASKDFLTVYNK